MYLAKRVGRWSLSQIGRFYNGRHHTTVLHAIEKIESLRRTDESIDALIDVLTTALSPDLQTAASPLPQSSLRSMLSEAVTARVIDQLAGSDRTMDRNQPRCRNSCSTVLDAVQIRVGVGGESRHLHLNGRAAAKAIPPSLPK